MTKEQIQILITDDDANFANAIQAVLGRAGYKAEVFTDGSEALSAARRKTYHILIVDCMLPKIHGVEVVKKIREIGGGSNGSILMSGIFKDRSFTEDAIQKSGASFFLSKPFEIEDLLNKVEGLLASVIESPKLPIFALLSNPSATHRDVRKAIENTELVNGLDLPYVYSLLMSSKISGHLNIISDDGGVSGISFTNGDIVSTDVVDKKTLLGSVLVEHGFLKVADLQPLLKTPNEKKVGQRLIEQNLLSPHALQVALQEQMTIRLGLTVQPGIVKLNFVQTDVESHPSPIGQDLFTEFLDDWLHSKIKLDWIKSFYLNWLDHVPIKSAHFDQAKSLSHLPTLKGCPGILDFLLSGKTLSQSIHVGKYPEEKLYTALHLFVMKGVLCFDSKKHAAELGELMARAKRLARDIQGRNYFEIFELLGVGRNAKPTEITRAYRDFCKMFHPDLIDASASPELYSVVTNVFGEFTRAYKILNDEKARKDYENELERDQVAKFLEADTLFEEGKTSLRAGQFKAALDNFEKGLRMTNQPTTDMKLYHIWAKIKVAQSNKNSAAITELESQLAQIPPEDRHNAIYFFVKGLLSSFAGDREVAKRTFEHALALDNSFLDVKRELAKFRSSKQNDKINLNSDLGRVFGMIFGKKG